MNYETVLVIFFILSVKLNIIRSQDIKNKLHFFLQMLCRDHTWMFISSCSQAAWLKVMWIGPIIRIKRMLS